MNGTVLSSSSNCTTASTWALRIWRSWAMRLRSCGCGAGGTAGTGWAGIGVGAGGVSSIGASTTAASLATVGGAGCSKTAVGSAGIVPEGADGVSGYSVVAFDAAGGSGTVGSGGIGFGVGSDGFIASVPGDNAGRLRTGPESGETEPTRAQVGRHRRRTQTPPAEV